MVRSHKNVPFSRYSRFLRDHNVHAYTAVLQRNTAPPNGGASLQDYHVHAYIIIKWTAVLQLRSCNPATPNGGAGLQDAGGNNIVAVCLMSACICSLHIVLQANPSVRRGWLARPRLNTGGVYARTS